MPLLAFKTMLLPSCISVWDFYAGDPKWSKFKYQTSQDKPFIDLPWYVLRLPFLLPSPFLLKFSSVAIYHSKNFIFMTVTSNKSAYQSSLAVAEHHSLEPFLFYLINKILNTFGNREYLSLQ